MTDNEIIKALECCVFGECEHECSAYKNEHINCIGKLKYSLFDLINRQKAEIERLTDENIILSQKRANLFEIVSAYERGRNEAIKEFAKRLKEKAEKHDCKYYMSNYSITAVSVEAIDNLVKEMTEGGNEE